MEKNLQDDLRYNLPDYITGDLNDAIIKGKIEARLLTDSAFREEYDSLKSTINFLESAELEAPSEVYFANLQANIISKVQKAEPAEKQSILEKLLGYWKIVVPALTVCVVIIIYSRNSETPQIPLPENKVKSEKTGDTNLQNHDQIIEQKSDNTNVSVQNDTKTIEEQTAPVLRTKKVVSTNNSVTTSDETVNISDALDGATIFGREDDSQAQDEYDRLSSDDQLDILQNLKEKSF
jgi:hypothetical protein